MKNNLFIVKHDNLEKKNFLLLNYLTRKKIKFYFLIVLGFILPKYSESQVSICPQFSLYMSGPVTDCDKSTFSLYVYFNTSCTVTGLNFNVLINPLPGINGIDQSAIHNSIYQPLRSKSWFDEDYFYMNLQQTGRIQFSGYSTTCDGDPLDFVVFPAGPTKICDIVYNTPDPALVFFNLGNIQDPNFRINCPLNISDPCPTLFPSAINPAPPYQSYSNIGPNRIGDLIEKLPGNCNGGGSGMICDVQIDHDDGNGNFFTQYTKSNSSGHWCIFHTLGYYAQVSAQSNNEFQCGVTTADIVAIQKHILGTSILSQGWQYIAADANLNDNITLADISLIRQYILGTLPASPSHNWAFIDKSAYNTISQPQDALQVSQFIIQNPVTLQSRFDFDFYGIKIGDVNGSCTNCTGNLLNNLTTTRNNETSNEEAILQVGKYQVNLFNKKLIPIFIKSNFEVLLYEIGLHADEGNIISFTPNSSLTSDEIDFKLDNKNLHIIINLLSKNNRFNIHSNPIGYIELSNSNSKLILDNTIENLVYGKNYEVSRIQMTSELSKYDLNNTNKIECLYSNDFIYLVHNLKLPGSSIKIYSLNGLEIYSNTILSNLVYGENLLAINKQVLSPGINIVSITTNDRTEVIKVMK